VRRHRPDSGDGLGCLLVVFAFAVLSMGLALCEASFLASPSGFAP
jgi:hypothetical protein